MQLNIGTTFFKYLTIMHESNIHNERAHKQTDLSNSTFKCKSGNAGKCTQTTLLDRSSIVSIFLEKLIAMPGMANRIYI